MSKEFVAAANFKHRKLLDKAEDIAAAGGSEFDIAAAFNIDLATLTVWLQTSPELAAAFERGRAAFREKFPRILPKCPRCGGWLDKVIEFAGENGIVAKAIRCLICGARFYHTSDIWNSDGSPVRSKLPTGYIGLDAAAVLLGVRPFAVLTLEKFGDIPERQKLGKFLWGWRRSDIEELKRQRDKREESKSVVKAFRSYDRRSHATYLMEGGYYDGCN